MDVTQILTAIDAEISRLQQARQAVAALDGASPIPARRPGRPKGSANAAAPLQKQRRENESAI